MKVKMILPALTEAKSPFWRPIKYSLFPPLGLATLAAFLSPDDEVELVDDHVERLHIDDAPDLVVIQVYITNAYRAYALADHLSRAGRIRRPWRPPRHFAARRGSPSRGQHLHRTRRADLPAISYRLACRLSEAALRFDGGSNDPWPPADPPRPDQARSLPCPQFDRGDTRVPPALRLLLQGRLLRRGRSFYAQRVDEALAEIERLPGRHLYFLDDHLLGDRRFAEALFEGMRGMRRLFQGAATVDSVLRGDLIEKAADAGLRSLFVGFETFSPENLRASNKKQNIARDYSAVTRRLSDLGIMINGSFVFGMDDDGEDVFARTVDWAVGHGVTTATFHIQTPYPGTRLHQALTAAGRITSSDWDRYDTRHVVYQPARLTPAALKAGYDRAYRDFYGWRNIARGALTHSSTKHRAKHFFYAAGWKKFEPLWDVAIKARRLDLMTPLLEAVLAKLSTRGATGADASSVSENSLACS